MKKSYHSRAEPTAEASMTRGSDEASGFPWVPGFSTAAIVSSFGLASRRPPVRGSQALLQEAAEGVTVCASAASVQAAELREARPEVFRAISWRSGTKGPLRAQFADLRVAGGPVAACGRHLPGEQARLLGERPASRPTSYA